MLSTWPLESCITMLWLKNEQISFLQYMRPYAYYLNTVLSQTHTIHSDHHSFIEWYTLQWDYTGVVPSMRGCQWTEHQCAHTTCCVDHLRGYWVARWIQPGEDRLIVWLDHGGALQTVGLSSNVSTKWNYTNVDVNYIMKISIKDIQAGAHPEVL